MKRKQVPPTIRRYLIPEEVVRRTCAFLRERGEMSVEGVVLWIGRVEDETTAAVVTEYIPEQVAYLSEFGLAVEITRPGLTKLIEDLPEGMFVLVRVHSHGEEAFHSHTDDANMVISHRGAISVVVPGFCQGGLDLTRCSVNELAPGAGWRELPVEEVKERFRTFPTKRG